MEAEPKSLDIPVFDFSKDELKPGATLWSSTCRKARQALEEYGCFIVDLHDKAPVGLLQQVFGALRDLFDLPTDTKLKNRYDKPMNGYVGQIKALPLHESMGIDNATCVDAIQSFVDIMWPDGNCQFRECVHKYAMFASELDQMITRMIFEGYGVGKHYDSYIQSTSHLLRLLKNRSPRQGEPNLGFITHTDKSFTTILHQNQINALEMETRDGGRINVDLSSPSKFMVIAGDALMAWSNDRVLSPRHRVIMNGKTDRYSMGLFAFYNGTVSVPEELVDDAHPLRYKPFDHIGLLYFYRTEEGYNSKCPIKAYCGVSA